MEWGIKSTFRALLFLLFVFSVKSEPSKLPTIKVQPSNYLIEIFTKKEHFEDAGKEELKFSGLVTVDFETPNDTSTSDFIIEMDVQSKTKINSATLKVGGKDVTIKKTEKNESKLIIECTKTVVPAPTAAEKFTLKVDFENPFGNDMTGFYRSSYTNSDGNKIWLLTTHFEPIFARKAFPCFDKPDLKAIFEVHITVPNTIKNVLSNTAVEKDGIVEDPTKKETLYKFKSTKIPMSTYLVAFTASNLKPSEEITFNSDYDKETYGTNRKLRTHGRAEIIDRGDAKLAQDIGKKALTELTNYLGLGYAFEKVDQVGIPDFSAGAMENWGHISFREKSLFINDKSTAATKQANVLTITHELVHQWFGNLVTLQSWDYIWLNEAFANYIEYIIADKFSDTKDWDLLKQLVVNEIHLRAFETDGLVSSKPLTNQITDESLIYSSFNDIPYSKGAAVLRMWNLQLPKNKFQESIKDYLNKRQTKTGNPDELYTAFKEKAMMDEENFRTWTTQEGYPVVELKKVNGSYILSQNRFLWGSSNKTFLWYIPITYSTDVNNTFDTTPTSWLKKNTETFDLKSNFKWIIINNHQAGYYRVNYEKENWLALSKALLEKDHSKIPDLNRAQLINDAFSLARSLGKEYIQYSTALELIKYLKTEGSFVAWKTALNSLDFLQTKLFGENNYNKFKSYISELIKPHFKTLNTKELKHIEKLMTVEISRWACSLEFDSCVKEAKDLYKNKTYDQSPDTQEIVLCTVVRKDNNAWKEVFGKYQAEKDSALKVMYISALGCTNDEKVAEEFLVATIRNQTFIRTQDLSFVLSSVYNGNLKNVEVAFKFIEKNYQEIAKKYGGINPLGKALVGVARKLKTKEQLKRLEDLTAKIKNIPEGSAAAESIENAINIVKSNVDWVEKRMKQVNGYFNSGSLLSYSFGLLVLSLLSVFQF